MALRGDDTGDTLPSLAFVNTGDDLLRAFGAVTVSALIIALCVFAHLIHPAFAVLIDFSLTAVLARWMPGVALVAVLFAAVFQNFFVAITSPLLAGESDFNIARGYSFIILCAAWSVAFVSYFLHSRGRHPVLDRMMNFTTIVFILIGFYFLLGFVRNPLPAIIYLRNISSAFMFFQLALIFLALYPIKLTHALMISGILLVIFGYMELFYWNEWMALTNGQTYWDLNTAKQQAAGQWDKDAAERGIVIKGFLDSTTVDLLNTPLLGDFKISITRLLGPNFHAISYAYSLSFFLIFAAFRGSFVLAVLLLPLLLFANAKGALIVLIFVLIAWTISRIFGTRVGFFLLAAALGAYFVAGIVIGLKIGDFHVLGFMGGVHNFLENPLGHGLGIGGNLSTNFSTLDWADYQAAGRTPIAIESAIGVMMYQMGLAAFIYIGCCIWISWKTVSLGMRTGNSLHIAAGFALLTVLVNGIFQEEALFSPTAIGLVMILNGIILGAAIRTGALR